MNISFFFLFKETFKEFAENFSYIFRLIAIWMFPFVLVATILSKFAETYDELGILTNLLGIYLDGVTWLVILPLLILHIVFNQARANTISFKLMMRFLLKLIVIFFYGLGLFIPYIILGFGAFYFFNQEMIFAFWICSFILALYFLWFIYIGIKLSFCIVNFFHNNLPVIRILKSKFSIKNAVKFALAHLAAIIAFVLPLLIIFGLIGYALGIIEARLDFSLFNIDTSLEAYDPFFSTWLIASIVYGFGSAFGIIFLSVAYKTYLLKNFQDL